MRRHLLTAVLAVLLGLLCSRHSAAQTPSSLTDAEFWRLIADVSEPDGKFAPQLMSNEDSAQFVMPPLIGAVSPGGAYLGVGSEPNFTYIAATRPAIALIVDIRRDNMLLHLLYKALFELSPDRASFVSRLFSRPKPAAGRPVSAAQLFDAFRSIPVDAALLAETERAVVDRLARLHGFGLSAGDEEVIRGFIITFSVAGPDSLKGFGDGMMLTYAQLMAATDLVGRAHGYLESDDRYERVRDLQQRNLIIPIVGDFAGDKALVRAGDFLRARQSTVAVFYVSNVERYLFEQGDRGRRFYANVAALPTTPASVFIRSVTTDISRRLAIPIPDSPARWRTFLASIQTCLDGITGGTIQGYRDLFVGN